MKHFKLLAACLLAMTVSGAATAASAESPDEFGVVATFEGDLINLAEGWGEARACFSDDAGARCYRTEAEMDRAEATSANGTSVAAACSSSLRLYSGYSYGGAVLHLANQHQFINLSGRGFNNITSSYRVGGCSSSLYDGAGGGAPQYPGNSGAWASATSMVSGWDNRLSSVYIN